MGFTILRLVEAEGPDGPIILHIRRANGVQIEEIRLINIELAITSSAIQRRMQEAKNEAERLLVVAKAARGKEGEETPEDVIAMAQVEETTRSMREDVTALQKMMMDRVMGLLPWLSDVEGADFDGRSWRDLSTAEQANFLLLETDALLVPLIEGLDPTLDEKKVKNSGGQPTP